MDRLKRIAPFLKPLLILALFAVALRVLHDTLAQYRYRDVIRYLIKHSRGRMPIPAAAD